MKLPKLPRVAWRVAIVVAAYLALDVAFAHAARSRGLLSPGGAPHLDVVALGATTLALRLVVRVLVPIDVAYALAVAAAARWFSRGSTRDR